MENLLPKTWKTKILADIAQIERGKFTHRPRNDPRFYGGKIPFVQTGDISNSNGRVREYKQTLNEDGLAISKVFPQGTILITIAANIGYTGILEFDSACPDSLIGISTNDEVYPDFLNFYLMTQQPVMDRLAPRGTQKNINIEFLKPWPVVVPPLNEQKKIAYVLSTVQRAIAQQEQLIKTTTELKKALMHKLFTEGLHGEKQKETAIGLVPKSWDVVPLEFLLTEPLRNGHSAKETTSNEGIPTLTLTAITQNDFSPKNVKITCADPNKVRDLWLQSGDIFVERANTLEYVGLAALYEGNSDFAIFPDLLIRVRIDKNRLLPKILVNYLLTDFCRVYFRKNVNSTTGNFPKISQPTIEKLLVPVPSCDEQIEIEKVFRTLDKKLEILKQKRKNYTHLFRTLLHQLMTAQIRVHDIDLSGFDDLDNITPQGSTQGAD